MTAASETLHAPVTPPSAGIESTALLGPLRLVTAADAASYRAGLLGCHGMICRRWTITLECGHTVERPVRYRGGRRGWSVLWRPPSMDQAHPLPKRIRCNVCLPNNQHNA